MSKIRYAMIGSCESSRGVADRVGNNIVIAEQQRIDLGNLGTQALLDALWSQIDS